MITKDEGGDNVMMPLKDLTGRRFGKVVVISYAGQRMRPGGTKYSVWNCHCDCGTDCVLVAADLLRGRSKSCGCLRKYGANRIDLKGQRFGRLTVLHEDVTEICHGVRFSRWICRCDCGNEVSVRTNSLRTGHIKSCGCMLSCGEQIVSEYLRELGICFIQQKTFPNLVGCDGGRLKFDFFLPELNLLIECQGVQHYKPIDYFDGDDGFAKVQRHDEIKKQFAADNGYRFLALDVRSQDVNYIRKTLNDYLLMKE